MRTRMIPLMGQSKALLRLQEGDGRGVAALSPPYPGGALYLIGPEAQALAAALDDAGQASLSLPFSPVAALVYAQGGFPLSGGFAGRTDLLEKAKIAVRLQTPAEKRMPPPVLPIPDAAVPPNAADASAAPEPEPRPRREASHIRRAGNAAHCEGAPAQQAGNQAQREGNAAQQAGGSAWQAGNQAQREAGATQQAGFSTRQAENQAQREAGPAQQAENQAQHEEDPKQATGPQAACDRQPQSDALLEILKKAQELFHGEPAAPTARPAAPTPGPTSISNPFPQAFPRSTWRRVSYPGGLGHYLSGEGMGRYGPYIVYALPGEYAPVPRRGKGFNKFLRATDGSGYWVRVVRKTDPPKQ